MLSSGLALAGSSYAHTGWAYEEGLLDQIAVLDIFNQAFGTPSRTIAWGHSLGGMITAGLIQRYPDRFDAALPMCGVLTGGVATWNSALDSAFAFKTLLAPGTGLQVVHTRNWSSEPRATPHRTRASTTARNLIVPSIKRKCLLSISERG